MVYINEILKWFLLIFSLLSVNLTKGYSQTCCSGGVPLSGNIGFSGAARGTLQMELSYDLNYLATLKSGSEIYQDESRLRITHSLLLKSGYSLRRWFAIDAIFSYVFQGRKITFDRQINRENTSGLGDAVLMAKFILSSFGKNGSELQLGLGPKLPLGRTDLTSDSGITLNADLQPGSGSWDLITWAYYARQFTVRPSLVASTRIVGRFNGSNRDYLGLQSYSFGNSAQLYLGIGDQFVWKNRAFSPSLSVRLRYAGSDRINGLKLDNTGGTWVFMIPAMSFNLRQNSIIHLIPEIPLYSQVDGTQLTPSFRLQLGFYHAFNWIKENKSNTYQL